MVDIINVASSFRPSVADSAGLEKKTKNDGTTVPARAVERTVRDTVDISAEGYKTVNLARGQELANALPDAKVDRVAFNAAIARALEDIDRVTTLFSQVVSQLQGKSVSAADTTSETVSLTNGGEQVVNLGKTSQSVERLRKGQVNVQDLANYLKTSSNQNQKLTSLLAESLKALISKR